MARTRDPSRAGRRALERDSGFSLRFVILLEERDDEGTTAAASGSTSNTVFGE